MVVLGLSWLNLNSLVKVLPRLLKPVKIQVYIAKIKVDVGILTVKFYSFVKFFLCLFKHVAMVGSKAKIVVMYGIILMSFHCNYKVLVRLIILLLLKQCQAILVGSTWLVLLLVCLL